MKRLLLAAIALIAMQTLPADAVPLAPTSRDRALAEAAFSSPFAAALRPEDTLVVVDAATQRLVLWQGGEPACAFPVSTARAGLGCEDGSGKTPTGWHRVAEWIGRDAQPGQVFVSRVPTGEVVPPEQWRSETDDDKILTCIMWLEGLEPGRNAGPGIDSHERFIYIHGTSQEQFLGTPASHGCIRLSNRDAAELFHRTYGHETLCLITE